MMRSEMTELMLEAMVSRVASTLEVLFPGSACRLVEKPIPGHGKRFYGGRFNTYEIRLETNHPRLNGGRFYTSHEIPVEYLRMEGDAFVRHLMEMLPINHMRQITEVAMQHASDNRFDKRGYLS